MQLKYTILYVDDVRRALAFYEAAFAQKTAFLHEGGDYGELAPGLLVARADHEPRQVARGARPRAPHV
jgi:catechol 2,3-dioxygenase-like lactoylglutathione lyase family enzyme